jgi:phosphomevalonate kinase
MFGIKSTMNFGTKSRSKLSYVKSKSDLSGIHIVQRMNDFVIKYYNYNNNKNINRTLKIVKKISDARNLGRAYAKQYNVKFDGLV